MCLGHALNAYRPSYTRFTFRCGDTGRMEPLFHLEGGNSRCMPVSCPVAEVPNAIPSEPLERNRVSFLGQVTYTCVDGYSLTGGSDGDVSFITPCVHDGKMQGTASCSRVRCDAPLAVEHADSTHSEADDRLYGDRVEHLVYKGRPLNGKLRD